MELTPLSVDEAIVVLKPLAYFVIGMAIYAVFIFNFYRFLGRKDIFELDLTRYERSKFRVLRSTLYLISYVGKYLILFPIVAFAWFVILTALLVFLSKNQTIENILLIAMAVLSAIRITAYYNEDLSRDLAKILPFALLGIFLIDLSYFSVATSINALEETIARWDSITYYLAFVIGLEFVMRVSTPLLKPVFLFGRKR